MFLFRLEHGSETQGIGPLYNQPQLQQLMLDFFAFLCYAVRFLIFCSNFNINVSDASHSCLFR